MINIKKGPGFSTHQVNFTGKAVAGQAVEAGHVVRLHTDGTILKGASTSPAPADAVYGFAANNQTDGDVVESGKISAYALDGASVIETDKAAATINATNYPVGALVTVDTAGAIVKITGNPAAGQKVIGQVEGIRDIAGRSISVVDSNGATQKVQGPVTVLGIKLFS